jgi:hypothetical protein
MDIKFDPEEYIAALGTGDVSDLIGNNSNIVDYVANNNRTGGYSYGTNNNSTTMTDPTYTSGLNYAQSIAGGQNVPNMIAPGMSYSAAMPQGYTQADLNVPTVPTVPAIPDDPSFLPGGDAVNPPDYTNLPPNIIGGGRGDNINFGDDWRHHWRNLPPQDILGQYKPFDLSGIQDMLDSLKQEKISVPDVPVIPDVPPPYIHRRLGDWVQPPIVPPIPPLEDIGFGPGIRRSEDFFRPEEMMPPMPPMEDINIPEIPDMPPMIPPMIPNGSTFSIEQPRYSLLK